MRTILNMVVRNEADRYLDACLTWIAPQVDDIFVYDDLSTDETVEIALDHGAKVSVRAEWQPSFEQAEGTFRQNGWTEMVSALRPNRFDWIVGIDADEFPMGSLIDEIEPRFATVDFQIPEIFLADPISERIDGFWKTITGKRMCRYQGGSQRFRTQQMGCGNFPAYAFIAALNHKASAVKILHYGYADPGDRQSKYDRYKSVEKHGHANKHIESILAPPQLKVWEGDQPIVWRGVV